MSIQNLVLFCQLVIKKNQILTSIKGRNSVANFRKTKFTILMLILSMIMSIQNLVSICLIMKTSPCNEDPLTSHFYIVKLGLTGVYMFFLFLLQNLDHWVLVRTASTCTHDLCFEQKKENITIFHTKIIIFTMVKYCSILHRRVCVMYLFSRY